MKSLLNEFVLGQEITTISTTQTSQVIGGQGGIVDIDHIGTWIVEVDNLGSW